MDRVFIIRVEYNTTENAHGTWVQLLEDVNPEAQLRYKCWYVDFAVRAEDVKPYVKEHIDFLKSFGVENITIDDRRRQVAAPSKVDSPAAPTAEESGWG